MNALIKSVIPGSIAAAVGITAGDRLLAVNGNNTLEDLFDYEFEVTSEEQVILDIEHKDGSLESFEIEKQLGEDLGLQFESPIFTPIKTCNNACPFCFIDQQPEGLRPSLYVKDDDYRLSYFCNTYITLTNLTRHDRERIARIRPGPLYVSVHSTVPEIRQQLLVNAKAGEILAELKWLASFDVPFHAQLVICPGINDGDSLTQTLYDLSNLRPHCLSVAIVPVGLTQHRDKLPNLTAMSQTVAQEIIQRLAAFEAETGLKEFAFASDEFYVYAQSQIPGYEAYGDFPQLEDGVGTARLLTQEFFEQVDRLPQVLETPKNYVVLTGKLGEMVLQPIVQRLNQVKGLFLDLVAVENRFWGEAVTVAGLITGQDILNTLQHQNLAGYDGILIPQTMLKSGEDVFLDGYSVTELGERLGCKFVVVREPTRIQSLLDILFPSFQQA